MAEPLTASAYGGEHAATAARRCARARAVHALAVGLIVLGALALVDAGVTVVWKEPLSALYASIRQGGLRGDLRKIERAAPSAAEQRRLAALAAASSPAGERERVALLAAELERHTGNGAAVGRILIPRVGANYVVVKGTDTEDLISGPGIYSETRFPGGEGTTAIAGHRTTYLAPFREINLLRPGNHILVYMPYAHFTYTVTGQRVVSPWDVSAAVANVGYPRLVLSACTPVFTAEKRLLVYARLTRVVPVGVAWLPPGQAVAQPIETPLHPNSLRAARRRLPQMLVSLNPHELTPLV